ncbi:hypothetical protein VNO77_39763 [Canavalia gladiata]|uniref:Uncharacterized protein n=1 Tax=Canavalia gladiata TaxID=3824 RepID=A0AAN9JZ97_CANGL
MGVWTHGNALGAWTRGPLECSGCMDPGNEMQWVHGPSECSGFGNTQKCVSPSSPHFKEGSLWITSSFQGGKLMGSKSFFQNLGKEKAFLWLHGEN